MDIIVPTPSTKSKISILEPQALHNNNNADMTPLREVSLEPSIIIRSDVIIRSLAANRDHVFGAGNKYNRKQGKSSPSKCAIRKWDDNGYVLVYLLYLIKFF